MSAGRLALGRGAELPIRLVERLGGETLVHLGLGEQVLVARAPGERALPDEGTLAVELRPQGLHWFDAASGVR